MSKKTTETEKTEKVMTKYDRKMERRRKEQEKEARAKKYRKITGIVLLVCLVVLVLGSIGTSLLRRYNTFHGTYVKVGSHELTKLEYDYYYNSFVNNYLSTYSYLLSYMGLDTTKDFDEQEYSDTMTWKDFFDQMTVGQIQEVKALNDDAAANGFTYDDTEDYESFLANLKTNVTSAGVTESQYYKDVYGEYATESRIKGFVKETLLASAYYEKLTEDNAPAQEEIDAYYAENKNDYDTVTYRSFTFSDADVTESSEEADRQEAVAKLQETANTFKERLEAGEDFNALCAEYTEDEEAKADYEDAEQDASLSENTSYSGVNYVLADWMFDEARTEGEIEVIPDEANARCYVVKFEGRNKDEETVNQEISDTLANEAAGEYVSGLTEKYEVTDVAGKLKYLTIQEAATEEAENSTETANAEESESSAETTDAEESAETTAE